MYLWKLRKEDAMELKKVNEGMVPSLEKTKYVMTGNVDMESMSM